MKAAVIHGFGPAVEVEVRELPRPRPGPGQGLIEVHASSVNPIDWKIPGGQMAARYGSTFPMVLGFDASGVVAEVGPGVTAWAPGDEVFGRSDVGAGGCYAEYAALNAGTVARKPAQLSHAEAAAMPLAALTALAPATRSPTTPARPTCARRTWWWPTRCRGPRRVRWPRCAATPPSWRRARWSSRATSPSRWTGPRPSPGGASWRWRTVPPSPMEACPSATPPWRRAAAGPARSSTRAPSPSGPSPRPTAPSRTWARSCRRSATPRLQRRELAETIARSGAEAVVDGSPARLDRALSLAVPVVRVRYAFEQRSGPPLAELVEAAVARRG